MERLVNIYSIICRYRQLFEDIFKYLNISLIDLKISSNNLRYLQLCEDIFNIWIFVKTMFDI